MLPTEDGDFRLVSFQDTIENELHLALVMGHIDPQAPILVRVHMQNILCDLFGTRRSDCGWPLRSALRRVAREGTGVVLLLRKREDARELVRRIRDYELHDPDIEVPRRNESRDLRTYGIGAQILSDLGVHKMRVLSAPKTIYGLSGFDMEIVEYVTCD